MANITIYKSVSLLYVISKFLGVSPYRIVKIDKTYKIISKPLDFVFTGLNFLTGMYIIYLSMMDQLGVKNLAPNEMTRQSSTFLIRTVIPINLLGVIITYIRRKQILKAVANLDYVDQELEEIGSPVNLQDEFEEVGLQGSLAIILAITGAVFTYAILRDLTDTFVMAVQLVLCFNYNINYLLFIAHFIGSNGGVKRRFIKLNQGFK